MKYPMVAIYFKPSMITCFKLVSFSTQFDAPYP